MHKENDKTKLKSFKNLYCDALMCALGKYLDIYDIEENDLLNLLSREEVDLLIEYSVLKNKIAGVGELNIKVPYAGQGLKYLDKYNIRGTEILSARQMTALTAGEAVGGRIGFDIENLLDYAEGYLAELADFTGQLDLPVFISFGRDIEDVGKLVNRYQMSPAELVESFGFLDRQCYLYGLNYIDKEDQKLLNNYNTTLIFMPKNDGEEGKGAINLYNFIFNGLKFCFSSGKCYNIDMLAEGKLALINTANLMHERGLIDAKEILSALQMEDGEDIEIALNEDENANNIFDKNVLIQDEKLVERLVTLEEQIKQITKRIKEKI